jgi:predicted RNA methylase
MNALDTVEALKGAGQDYEWYPTTPEIIRAVDRAIPEGCSFLDVGAGRGDVLAGLRKPGKRYAIEKSEILLAQLPADVFVVGTDFHRQTLIDKDVDVVFSNPPFGEFAPWCERIIMEAAAKHAILVMPARWKEDPSLQAAIKRRGAGCRKLGEFSFEGGERKARGTVHLVEVSFRKDGYSEDFKDDPFKHWFAEHFPQAPSNDSLKEEEKRKAVRELVKGRNPVQALEELYSAELAELIATFRKIASIPEGLLREVGVGPAAVRGALQLKIKGLKNLYWSELFNSLSQITERLTGASRKAMLETLTAHTSVDFTAENAYAVVVWAIRNANLYIDGQAVDLFLDLSNQDTAVKYKSNVHFTGNARRYGWRYCKHEEDNPSHYKLDYRIVYEAAAFGGYDFERTRYGGVSERAATALDDLCAVAGNLGFKVEARTRDFEWVPGEPRVFRYKDGGVFMRVRAFKKGTVHMQVDQEFMLRFNVAVARIKKWVATPEEAAEEMQEPLEAVGRAFGQSMHLGVNVARMLSCGTA